MINLFLLKFLKNLLLLLLLKFLKNLLLLLLLKDKGTQTKLKKNLKS